MQYDSFFKISISILVILILSVLLIKRFVYFNPTFKFIPYKENYKDVSEGNLHGWSIEGTNGNAILICHGNTGNISHRQTHIDSLNTLGYTIMIFDYSGYGRSRGIPSENQMYHDASIFINILLKNFNKHNIILYGESMGASVASYIALKYQINTLIIDSGLPSIKKYIKVKYPILSILGFLFSEFNTEKYISRYKGRLLILHSLSDEIIPYDITDVIRNYATHNIIINGTHNNRVIPWNEIDLFIQQNIV